MQKMQLKQSANLLKKQQKGVQKATDHIAASYGLEGETAEEVRKYLLLALNNTAACAELSNRYHYFGLKERVM